MSEMKKRTINNEELHKIIGTLLKTTDQLNMSNVTDQTFGSDYYDNLLDTGTVGLNRSAGMPLNNTINRYYDESRNYSVLAPVLDPLNVYNLSRRARQSIQENDWSESYFFSGLFEKNDIEERLFEKNLNYSKRLEWYRINEVKRRPPFQQLLAFNLLLLDKLDNILRYNIKHYILDKIESTPKGKNFYVKTVFPQLSGVTKIDFTDLSKCVNPPANFNYVNFPSTELFSIIVRVDAGGPIQIGLNEGDKDMSTYIDLAVNEEHKIDNSKAIIKSINVKANGSDATVRIIGLY